MIKNKYAYLGFVGLLGLLGFAFSGNLWFFTLCVFFIFFAFSDMVPDELFQENLKRAAWRALMVYFVLSIVAVMIFVLGFSLLRRALNISMEFPAEVDLFGFAEIPTNYWAQLTWMQVSFLSILMITVCVFCFTILCFNHREKRALAQAEAEEEIGGEEHMPC